MIGFGKDNEEFGEIAPVVTSFEEVKNEDGFAENALRIQIISQTGIEVQIEFSDYIMHMTRPELYCAKNEHEFRKGKCLIVFERSKILDCYDSFICSTPDQSWPGKGTHYGVYTDYHIIDIISTSKPKVSIL